MNSPLEYFEIFDGGDMVRVGVIEVTNNPSIDHLDKIWLETLVTAKGCTFSGRYSAQFMPVDFYQFYNSIPQLRWKQRSQAVKYRC